MSNVLLYSTAFTASLLSFSIGNTISWTSPVLPKLSGKLEGTNHFASPITKLQESWITSLLGLGSMFGPIIAGLFLNRIGRRTIMIITSFAMLISYVIIAFAPSIEYIYFSRFVLGLGCGCVIVVMPIYLSEIAKDSNRGSVMLTLNVMVNLGNLMCYAVGPYVSVKVLSLICTVPVVLFLLFVWFIVPESPYYFALTENHEAVVAVLMKLRRNDTNCVLKEALSIIETVQSDKRKTENFFINKTIVKSFLIILTLIIFHQMSGNVAIMAYMQSIFIESGSTIPTDISTIIIGIIQCFSIILTSLMVDKFGRRSLLSVSTVLCSISLFLLGTYFYLKRNSFNVDAIFWLPITALISFTIFFRVGFGPLPSIMMAEVFPTSVKTLGTVIIVIVSSSFVFLVTMIFPIFSKFGMDILFWIFSGCCGVCFVFVVVFLPETKGKSFQEIQDVIRVNNVQINI